MKAELQEKEVLAMYDVRGFRTIFLKVMWRRKLLEPLH